MSRKFQLKWLCLEIVNLTLRNKLGDINQKEMLKKQNDQLIIPVNMRKKDILQNFQFLILYDNPYP